MDPDTGLENCTSLGQDHHITSVTPPQSIMCCETNILKSDKKYEFIPGNLPELHFVDCENIKKCEHCLSKQVSTVSSLKDGISDTKDDDPRLLAENSEYDSSKVPVEVARVKTLADRFMTDMGRWTSNLPWTPANRSNSVWWAEENPTKAIDKSAKRRYITTMKVKNKYDLGDEGLGKLFSLKDIKSKHKVFSEWDLRSGLQAVSNLDISTNNRRYSGSSEGKPPLPFHLNRTGSLRPGIRLQAPSDTIKEGLATSSISINTNNVSTNDGKTSHVNVLERNRLLPLSPTAALSRSMDTLLVVS